MKTCRKCGAFFDTRHCKTCANTHSRMVYANNRERERIRSKSWNENNPEKRKAVSIKWRLANVEKVKITTAKWATENPERMKELQEKWMVLHPKYQAAWVAKWRKENPLKAKAKDAKWYAKHSKTLNAKSAQWRRSHPETKRIYRQNREAKKRENGGVLSQGLADKLFKLQKGKCPCCGMPLGKSYHLDHKMPLALGGANEDWNMQLLRQRCNNQKHAKHPIDFMQERGFLL